jgi:hypothetical protein
MRLNVINETALHLAGFEFTCYILSNDLHVFSHVRLLNIMMIDHTNQHIHKHLSALIPFLPFLFIERKLRLSVVFTNRRGYNVRGIAYNDFKTLCTAIVNANKQEKLPPGLFLMASISAEFLLHDEKKYQQIAG